MGDDRPSNLIAGAKELMAAGYDACKFNICEELQIVDTNSKVDGIVRQLCELREAVGSDIDLAFDFHGRVHAPMAKFSPGKLNLSDRSLLKMLWSPPRSMQWLTWRAILQFHKVPDWGLTSTNLQ